jgi:hypothetical protein
MANKWRGLQGMLALYVAVVAALWGLQALSISRLPDCNLSAIEWLKGVSLFSPACEISTRNVEPDQIAGFAFRLFFTALITILSLPAFLFAYRDSRN